MALKGSRIKNFDDLWCLGASGGLEFCVHASTSFQKSNIGWPQQPPTEKLLTALKFGLSEKHSKFEKIFFVLWTFTK